MEQGECLCQFGAFSSAWLGTCITPHSKDLSIGKAIAVLGSTNQRQKKQGVEKGSVLVDPSIGIKFHQNPDIFHEFRVLDALGLVVALESVWFHDKFVCANHTLVCATIGLACLMPNLFCHNLDESTKVCNLNCATKHKWLIHWFVFCTKWAQLDCTHTFACLASWRKQWSHGAFSVIETASLQKRHQFCDFVQSSIGNKSTTTVIWMMHQPVFITLRRPSLSSHLDYLRISGTNYW